MRTKKYTTQEFWDFMCLYKHKNGQYPCNQRLQEEFGVTAMTVISYWKRLEEEGTITIEDMKFEMERRDAPTHKLVDRQPEILNFLEEYQKKNGYAPSATDIAKSLGVSEPIVYKNLNRMEQRGIIIRTPHVPRSIVVL